MSGTIRGLSHEGTGADAERDLPVSLRARPRYTCAYSGRRSFNLDAAMSSIFSGVQWLWIIFLDVFVRTALLFALSFNVLLLPFGFVLSIAYVSMLLLLVEISSLLIVRRRMVVGIAVGVATALLVILILSTWIHGIKDGQQTVCLGNDCLWVDGIISWSGMRTIAFAVIIQAAVCALPLLFRAPSTESESAP